MSGSVDAELVVLVPDNDIGQFLRGLLTRTRDLEIAPVHFDVTKHLQRDPGCRTQAVDYLRPYCKTNRRALVVFDWAGCGSTRSRVEIQRDVEGDLARDWLDRSKAIVIDPEFEVWVWSESRAVAQTLGWGEDFPHLRKWLASEGLWASDHPKPLDPKDAVEKAMAKAGIKKSIRRSPTKFHDLATKVDFTGCTDPAFVELRQTLRAWFPPETTG